MRENARARRWLVRRIWRGRAPYLSERHDAWRDEQHAGRLLRGDVTLLVSRHQEARGYARHWKGLHSGVRASGGEPECSQQVGADCRYMLSDEWISECLIVRVGVLEDTPNQTLRDHSCGAGECSARDVAAGVT
jgi:hypothetical protein